MRLLLMSVSIRMGRYGSVWGMSQKRAKTDRSSFDRADSKSLE